MDMEEQAIINTFNKGINQDVDFILQPDGTYRNMKNGMLISMDGHHFTIEISKGNKSIKTLNPRYTEDETLFDSPPMPIGFVSFVDKLVVFSTNDVGTGGYGEIGVMTFKKIQDDFVSTYTPYYHHPDLNFSKYHKIEGFSFRENESVERVYFTDNNNEPRVFDIANPIFTNYIGTSGIDITPGILKQYMVLEGVIYYAGNMYGPTDGSGAIVSNIFYSNGIDSTYILITPAAKVIECYPLSLLDWTPSRNLGNIKFKEYAAGAKNCGSSVYFYRLYSSEGKVSTTWSYPSTPIHVGMNNIGSALTGNKYRDFVGNGSTTTLALSPYSVVVTISGIDTDFDTIELCCAEYTQVNDVPYIIKIVNRVAVTGTEMDIEDNGGSNFGDVSISDLTLFPASILKVKTLTTDKNYNLIGNITEREEFDLDLTGVTLSQFQYPMPSHGDITNCSNGNVFLDVSPSVVANPGVGGVLPHSRWIVKLGNNTTDTVEYPSGSGTFYVTGQIITGIEYSASVGDESAIAFTGSASVRPCTTRNRYTSIATGDRVEDYIEFTNQDTSFWDYKNPAVASHNKGYWSSEKYRFGILFFDKKGNPYYVKYINDFDFSTPYAKGGLMVEDNISSSLKSYALNPSAIKLSDLNIPESIMNEVSGFSIVRAERDKRILTQGLLMQTVIDPTIGANRLMPLGISKTNLSYYDTFYTPKGDLSTCICPDWLVGYVPNNTQSGIGYIGEKIEEAFWLDGGDIRAHSDFHVLTTKMFNTMPPDTLSPRVRTLQSMNGSGGKGFDEYHGDVDLIDDRDFYNRESDLSAYSVNNDYGFAVNYSCVASQNWDLNYQVIPLIKSVGCRKLMIMPSAFNHYGPAPDSYNWWGQRYNYKKIVINFLSNKEKSAQYGGQSESAIANTLYISTGHFQPINDAVKADTLNGSFPNGENKYTFNDIEIFGGDCFTNLFDINYGLWSQEYQTTDNSMSYSLFFPCEGTVNYNLRRGNKASNISTYPAAPNSINWDSPSGTILEGYSYNKGYSTDGTAIKYPGLPFNFQFSSKFEYRTRFAGIKYPGEAVDSFRKFLTADYKDLDGQLGEINNIRSKDGRVLVWQNHAVSSVPVLERQLLASTSGAATTIGTGGVIDRFDPINSYFGNQHQHGLTSTEFGYVWFDMRNRALCIMSVAGNVQEISLVKGLQSYFNNQFNEGDDNTLTPSNIYNTNNYSMPEIPLLGYGIVGVYDPRYKMSYVTFKYAYDESLLGKKIRITAKDFTIGYSHVLDAIVGFYDFTPGIWHNHNDLVLSVNNSKNYVYYGANMPETTFNIGDVVKVDNDDFENSLWGEYVCIKPVTIYSYLVDASLEPAYPGSVYWVKINSENEIYLQTFNTDYCKFYGKVYDHEVEVIVNPKADQAFSVLRIQQKSNDTNYSSVYFSTDDQSAQDTNIVNNSKTYRYIDKSYYSSAPLPRTGGRLTDHYVKIKFVLKNYLTNPTIAKNKNKIFQFLKTWFISRD
jgi:hypothetical protein